MFNSRQTLLFALFGLFTVVLVLGSLTHTDYLKQTQPNVGPYWGQDESGNAVQIYPMFNFSPYAYKGIWSCGWPFALFTFEAQDVADEEGPFFPFHNLSELQIVWHGWFTTLAIAIPVAFLAAIGFGSVVASLSMRLTIQCLFITTALFAYYVHATLDWIEEQELLVYPAQFATETIIKNLVVPLSHLDVWTAMIVLSHPAFLRRWWRYYFTTTKPSAFSQTSKER